MQNFTMMDIGWSANVIKYGGGLMIMWFQNQHGAPELGTNSTLVGHGGETYGYTS